jgi:HlyD family secretion protein
MSNTTRFRAVLRKLFVALTFAALLAGGAWYTLRPVEVRVGTVAVRDLAPRVHGVGTVEAKTVVQISSKITGWLVAVLVDQGDAVRPGQIVARLEDTEHRALVEQAEASVRRAVLAVAVQEVALRKAQTVVGAADASIARVRAAEALARTNAERWWALHADGGVPRVEMDAKITEAAVTREELRSAEAQGSTAREEVAVLQATLESIRQDVRVAEATLATVRARQADTAVKSAVGGMVISRDLEPGATVTPGMPILKLADPKTAWATVHVDERETGAITVGDAAEIVLRSRPARAIPGRVARIRRESDRVTEQLAVDVAFDTAPAPLTFGEQLEASIFPAGERAATVMPLAALVRTGDGPAAIVVVGGRLRFRPIRTGLVDPGGWVQVREGLAPGDRVVVTPGRLADPANDGRRVRIENEQPTADNAK